ncbi:MAG: helix-turn-helix domain-containing protein [Deltaproteobacteria bacterium]|nr:helix-turn-helix domain-containing protein [Deltaproteobacteria bacterium]
MRYHIDAAKLKQIITQRGYAHVTEFAKAHGFNRSTINNYLKGNGGPFSETYYVICDTLQIDPLSILSPFSAQKTDDIEEIIPVVKKLCSVDLEIAVGLLGSRAKGNNRKYSDWDLCITRGGRALTGEAFLKLKRTVDEEVDKLPREVDFVNLDVAPAWFLLGIDYEPIFLAGNSNSWSYFMGVLYGTKKGK